MMDTAEVRKERLKNNRDDDNNIYRWIRSAIQMGAEEVKLTYFGYCYIAPPGNQFHFLATLELENVLVDEATLETIFSTCVNLWKLVLRKCHFLTKSIIGIILKRLQMFSPRNLDKLQVSAPNLTYFEYWSDYTDTQLCFTNVPKLEVMLLDLPLGNRRVDDMFRDFAPQQLKRLMSLHTRILDFNLEPQVPVTSTILCQLEQLELVLIGCNLQKCNLFKMIPLLVACPLLQKFHLTTSGRPTNVPDDHMPSPRKHPFPNLKEVEIRTFYFTQIEISFVFYMLENGVALERMVLDTTPKICFHDCKIKHLSHELLPNQQIRAMLASPTAKLVLQHHPDDRIAFANLDYWQFWSYIDYELLKDYLIGVYDGSYRWIRSAILMGDEELNFTYNLDHCYVHHRAATAARAFSFEILSGLRPSKWKHLRLQNCSIALPAAKVSDDHQPVNLHSLATLEFEDFLVDQTILKFIFSSCVNLRKLVLRKCKFQPNLTIAGPTPSISLMCLQIFSPIKLNKLQVSAEKLTYFEYKSSNPNTQLSFTNVPELEEMILDLQLGNRRVDDMFTDNAPQLKRLMSLYTTIDLKWEPQIPVTMAMLCQLEQLELILGCWRYCNLLKMIPILVACPLLQKFDLIASGQPTNVPDMQYPSSKHPFPNLKHVQIRKFYGTSSEIPFVFYMLENVVALEQMILDTTPKSCRDCKIKHLAYELPNQHQRIRANVASSTAKLVFQYHSNERIEFANIFVHSRCWS
ncbi:hypothetical protein COLO4_09859 [Corchorus olitorius]|uniref:At1g61320/AtMIF1 LRR domain-containing protein n=1 Tax=Corchorus olitorius TaxID=93759 RepID=A0A1R3KAY3_9ROSI|nr:hypothetical protein COLO4_09859 [Corchorus olitorius]